MASSPITSKTPANGIQYQGGGMATDQNVPQKHVAFFDQNNDGILYPWETFQEFVFVKLEVDFSSSVAALFINMDLSSKTRPGKFPSLLFPIEIKKTNIHKAKHGSDSGVYDTQGRFVPSKFEQILREHARTNSVALTSDELMGMLKSNRELTKGWHASYTEWKILYVLCKDKNGLLQKDTIRAAYDGSLVEQIMAKESVNSSK